MSNKFRCIHKPSGLITNFVVKNQDGLYRMNLQERLIIDYNGNVAFIDLTGRYHKLDDSEDYKVMWSTGIIDVNGREIYEGDIVEGRATVTLCYTTSTYNLYNAIACKDYVLDGIENIKDLEVIDEIIPYSYFKTIKVVSNEISV